MVQVGQVEYAFSSLPSYLTDYANLLSSLLVWYAAQEEQDRRRAAEDAQRSQAKEQARVQREEMRKEMLGEK